MASQVWPASLPQSPLINGSEETTPNNIVRTQMDQGPAKVRRRSTANVKPVKMQFVMDKAQLNTFETFFNDTVKGGALKFDFPEPVTQTVKEYRFKGQPTKTPLSATLFRIEVEMEELP